MAQAFATMMDGTRREVPVEVNGNLFRVPVNGIPQDTKSLEIHLDDFCATAGTDGYFLIPTVTESNRPSGLVRFHPRTDTEYVSAASNLPLFGIKNGSHAVLAIMRGMNIFYDLVYGVRDGKYYLHPRIRLNGEAPYETPEILLLNLYGEEADWAGMARAYRRYQIERGACVPLRERAKKYPVLAETARGTLIRIRLAWKPVPPPVLEQTPETEPPVFAAVTLKRCGEIIEECHRKGIRNLEFSIVGWNIGGHDGRWPDVFPVEPKIGTEEELKALIRKAKEYGYLFSNHANAIGSYAISSRRKESMLLRDRDGKPCNGGQWGGGQSSQLCPKATHHLRVEDMEKYVELGFRVTQYYDAISMIQPLPCHHPDHPLNPRETGEWRGKTLALAREKIGASASEGGMDFAIGCFDYALYAIFELNPKRPEICDEYVPFWYIVYHGILTYNSFCESVNGMVKKDPDLMLRNLEYGGRPLAYFYAKFMHAGDNWMGNEDMCCATDEQLRFSVDAIAKTQKLFETISDLQYEFLDEIRIPAPGIESSRYANGTTLVFNCTNAEYVHCGKRIAPHSFARFDR